MSNFHCLSYHFKAPNQWINLDAVARVVDQQKPGIATFHLLNGDVVTGEKPPGNWDDRPIAITPAVPGTYAIVAEVIEDEDRTSSVCFYEYEVIAWKHGGQRGDLTPVLGTRMDVDENEIADATCIVHPSGRVDASNFSSRWQTIDEWKAAMIENFEAEAKRKAAAKLRLAAR